MTVDHTFGADALNHYAAGVVVSLSDYTAYRLRNKKADRIEQKVRCLESIDTILNAQDMPRVGEAEQTSQVAVVKIDRDSAQYALNVADVKRFLTMEGYIKEPSVGRRIVNYVKSMPKHELVNPLNAANTLYFAMVTELAENVVAWDYYTNTVGDSPIGGIARNGYQIPLFFAGLMTGKMIRKPLHWMTRSGDEKKADKAINQLVLDTSIVDIVQSYEPTPAVEAALGASGLSFQMLATPFSKGAKALTEGVMGFGARLEEKRVAESQQRMSSFDELTKGK